jgi:hypothetical protein
MGANPLMQTHQHGLKAAHPISVPTVPPNSTDTAAKWSVNSVAFISAAQISTEHSSLTHSFLQCVPARANDLPSTILSSSQTMNS